MAIKLVKVVDKEAIVAPTSKMIKMDEFKNIRPKEMARQLAFIFKPRKPINIEEDYAQFLVEKYPGAIEIIGKIEKYQPQQNERIILKPDPPDIKLKSLCDEIVTEWRTRDIDNVKKVPIMELREISIKLGLTDTGKKATVVSKVKRTMGL